MFSLSAGDMLVIKWYMDTAYAVHSDFRSHMGGMMSLHKGSIYSVSTKQKLNMKSSSKAELVVVDDVMPHVLWTNYFLQAQG